MATQKLFQSLDIPQEFVPLALTALKKHSQNECFGGSNLNKDELISKNDGGKIDAIFKQLEIPFSLEMPIEKFKDFFNDHFPIDSPQYPSHENQI